MKTNFIIIAVFMEAILLSCNPTTLDRSNHTTLDRTLRLNDGHRWKANEVMTRGIKKMITIVDTANGESFDTGKVAYRLDFEIRMMMSVCDPSSSAHDQFHNYLYPLKEQINGLRIANAVSKGPLLKSIKRHLNVYNTYFN